MTDISLFQVIHILLIIFTAGR